jgi:hypothetical protein
MFHAFVIACAANLNMEIDRSSCIILEDTWGPYKTEEHCIIRANQMYDEAREANLNLLIMMSLNYPSFVYSESRCRVLEGETA